MILTTCQLRGACQSTFTSIAAQLGNKSATEVSHFILEIRQMTKWLNISILYLMVEYYIFIWFYTFFK